MKSYFAREFIGEKFQIFSNQHLLALLAIFIIVILLYGNRNNLRQEKVNKTVRYTLAALLLLQELSLNVWRLSTGLWEIQTSLPLHLCGVAILCSAVMLVRKQYLIYELVYFWGLGGALQALLTPDIIDFNFPHYRFFQYFLSHGLIIIAALFMTFVERYRPTWRSIGKTMVVTNLYMVVIAMFNALTGANYLFICQKPESGSLLDILGPWPWYILSLEIVAVISFTIYYLPFALKDVLSRKKGTGRTANG